METYSLEKHRELIEKIRFIGMFVLGFLAGSHFLLVLILVLVIGSIDQFFVKPRLKPREK